MKARHFLNDAPIAMGYFAFAGSVTVNEAIAGSTAIALAAAFAALYRQLGVPLAFKAPWMKIGRRLLTAVAVDSCRVALVMLRQLGPRPSGPSGRVRDQRFVVRAVEPAELGRRGLVILAVSMAPNKYVADTQYSRDCLVLHELAPTDASPDAKWPL